MKTADATTAWRGLSIALTVLNLLTGALFGHLFNRQTTLEARLQGVTERESESTARMIERLDSQRASLDRIQRQQDHADEMLTELKVYVYPQGRR